MASPRLVEDLDVDDNRYEASRDGLLLNNGRVSPTVFT